MAADAGGFAAQHPARRSLPVLVAPSLGGEKNTVVIADVPLACWRLDAARFDFDSSVIHLEAEDDLTLLAGMFDSNDSPVLTVFGHADPVGDDEYNKALSGRRTKALYGLLTRNIAMWKELAITETWPQAAFTMMQSRTGKPAGTPRDELFQAYMDAICHRPDGTPFTVDRSGFLGRGLDPGGRADYQGCSEFNPVLRLSAAEEKELSPQERHPERDARNAPNRRVLVFMFTAGTFAPAADWPCPRATDSASGCRAQFWPDGDQRRAAQDQERTYEHDKNTFACAHYDRMARRSPCEQLPLQIDGPIDIIMLTSSATAEAVVSRNGTVTQRFAAVDDGDGKRRFRIEGIPPFESYRVEISDPEAGVLAAWTLKPAEFHRAMKAGNADQINAAFSIAET